MRAKLNVREDTEGMSESIFHPRRVLAVLVVITVLLAAVAAFLSSTGESTKYSPGTPEGVVQLYLTAVIEGKMTRRLITYQVPQSALLVI